MISSSKVPSFLILLFVLGLAHWVLFFHYGNLSFNAYDWPKEFKYYSILKQSLSGHAIPYHISESFQGTNRFLALPETLLSPQIVFLAFLPVKQFIMLNTLFLYSLGFLGCLLIRRKYKLSLLPFSILYLLFNYNGYITSHIAVGHSMWNGYFLLPFFGLCVIELTEEKKMLASSVKLSLFSFALILQGSFHVFIWCALFLLLFALFNRRYFKSVFLTLVLTILLCAFRLVPAAITFYHKDFAFVTGYKNLWGLFDALALSMRSWWEFDAFVSIIGLAILAYFGIYQRFSKDSSLRDYKYQAFDWPLVAMVVLSLGQIYGFLSRLPIPFANAERVSSRFIIIPFLFLLIFSVSRMQQSLAKILKDKATKVLAAAIVFLLGILLLRHSYVWRITELEKRQGTPVDLSIHMINLPDKLYIFSVKISAIISLVAILLFVGYFCRAFFLKTAISPSSNIRE